MEFGSAVANGGKDIVSEDELANHNKVLDTYGPPNKAQDVANLGLVRPPLVYLISLVSGR
jgi:hypothetical protein